MRRCTDTARIEPVWSATWPEPDAGARLAAPHGLPGRELHRRRARGARPALHQPRPARLRPGQPARDRQGRDVRALFALPGHAAAAVPGRVRRRPRGGARRGLRRRGGRARAQALRAHLPRLRRRLGGPARRGAHRLRVGLQRDDQGAPARPAGRLPGAVDALHRLRPADARRRLPLLAPPRARAASTTRAMDFLFDTYSRSAAAGDGLGRGALPARRRRARGGPPRSLKAKALDLLRGLLPAASLSHMGIFATRPGLRAAAAAPARLAAARGARLRAHDPGAS